MTKVAGWRAGVARRRLRCAVTWSCARSYAYPYKLSKDSPVDYSDMLKTDPALQAWGEAFAGTVTASVGAEAQYGLTAEQAGAFVAAQTAFAAAMEICRNVGTRTRADVAAKNAAKAEFVAVARQTVDLCQAWPQMTDAKREQLQITVRSKPRRRVPRPATAPIVSAVSTGATSIRVSARNVEDATRRAKPAGVRQLETRTMLGGAAVGDPLTWPSVDLSGRTDVDLAWPTQASAATVWVSCCWVNGRNERGPMSPAVAVRLAGTGYASATQEQGTDATLKIAA